MSPWFWIWALLALPMACTYNDGQLAIHLLFPPDKPQLLENRADYLRLRVDGPQGRYGPIEVALSRGRALLPDVPVGSDQEITIDGLLEPGGLAQVRARSGPIEIKRGLNSLELMMGDIDRFNLLPATNGRSGMKERRAFHSATLLEDGSVIFVGGTSLPWRPLPGVPWPAALASIEKLEGEALRFDGSIDCSGLRCLRTPRVGHSATRLPSGSVLIIGGSRGGPAVGATNRIELYSPKSRKFLDGDFGGVARANHRAVAFDQGVLLLSGASRAGSAAAGQPDTTPLVESVEYYAQGTLSTRPRLNPARRDFAVVTLLDGTILVSGGFDAQGLPLSSTTTLKPGAPQWTPGPALSTPRAHHTATVLQDGTVLFIGGLTTQQVATNSIERYWPSSNAGAARIEEMARGLRDERWAHTASLIDDGRIVVAGGFRSNANGSPTVSVEILRADDRGVSVPLQPLSLSVPRAGHSATRLRSGLLLVAGGASDRGITASAEVFIY